MEAKNQETDWREVALMLNGANEMLTEEIHQLNQEYVKLQAKHKSMQNLRLITNKGASLNN